MPLRQPLVLSFQVPDCVLSLSEGGAGSRKPWWAVIEPPPTLGDHRRLVVHRMSPRRVAGHSASPRSAPGVAAPAEYQHVSHSPGRPAQVLTGQRVLRRLGLSLGDAAVHAPRVSALVALCLLGLCYEPSPWRVVAALRCGSASLVGVLLPACGAVGAACACGEALAVQAWPGGHGLSTSLGA